MVSVIPAIDALKKLKIINSFAFTQQLIAVCGFNKDQRMSHKKIVEHRQKHLARSLNLSYQEPIKNMRGQGCYLYDDKGNAYLDMVNNVCHVCQAGHLFLEA